MPKSIHERSAPTSYGDGYEDIFKHGRISNVTHEGTDTIRGRDGASVSVPPVESNTVNTHRRSVASGTGGCDGSEAMVASGSCTQWASDAGG